MQEGAAEVITELFEDYGLIAFTNGGKSISHVGGGKILIIYGDYLSMEHLGSMGVKLLESLGDASKVDNARAVLAALERTHPCPGDLHIPMHKIDEIYRLTYGGFLQAFQAALRQKRIQMNPIPRYQASRRLAVLVYEESLRLASQQWSEGLSELEIDGTRVAIESAAELDAGKVILALAKSFDGHLRGLVNSGDAVVSFVGQFITEMRSFVLYEQAVKSGDSVACELILLSWHETMALSGKSKYVELISRWIEAGYGEMTPATLQLQRLNRFLLLTAGKGRMGMDDGCEMLNLWTKVMGGSNELDAVINKTLFLPLMRRCGKSVDALFGSGAAPPKSTTTPKEKQERKAISDLLEKASALTNRGRVALQEDTFWACVAACSVAHEPDGDAAKTAREETISSLFAKVASSAAVDAPEDGWGSIGDSVEEEGGEEAADDGRVDRMSKYKFSTKAVGNWRANGKVKLAGQREKREAKKAEKEKFKAQIKEAVELHEKVRAETAASVKALKDGGLGGESEAEEPWLLAFQESMEAE